MYSIFSLAESVASNSTTPRFSPYFTPSGNGFLNQLILVFKLLHNLPAIVNGGRETAFDDCFCAPLTDFLLALWPACNRRVAKQTVESETTQGDPVAWAIVNVAHRRSAHHRSTQMRRHVSSAGNYPLMCSRTRVQHSVAVAAPCGIS